MAAGSARSETGGTRERAEYDRTSLKLRGGLATIDVAGLARRKHRPTPGCYVTDAPPAPLRGAPLTSSFNRFG